MSVIDCKTTTQCADLIRKAKNKKFVALFFYVDFHEPSKLGGEMDKLYTKLALETPEGSFLRIDADADETEDIAEKFDVETAPTFIFVNSSGSVLSRVNGVNATKLTETVQKLAKRSNDVTDSEENKKNARLKKLIHASHVMLFMKGTPSDPYCKFSRKVVSLLKECDAEFGSFDILKDDEVRQGLKTYSDWKTYPQLYVAGKLIGGHDIVVELAEDDELKDVVCVKPPAPPVSLDERIKGIISSGEVVLFMKGVPDEPRCGFSRRMVSLLRDHKIQFKSFDILQDNEVRQRLKTYSNWPTYPQLYVNESLIGGLDIVTEMAEEDEPLSSQLGLKS